MGNDQDTNVTVNDRRMFNPDGTLRQPIANSETNAGEITENSSAPSVAPKPSPVESKPAQRKPPLPEFANLVEMLTTNAILNLGAAPQYGKVEVDIETARHFIDMLAALKEKTEGNLAEEEEQLLTDMLSRLRMEYVDVVNQMSKSAKKKV